MLPPASPTGVCPVMMQCNMLLVRHRCCAHRHHPWPCRCTWRWSMAMWPSTVWPRQQWHFVGVALASLPALHWCHCQRQAVLVAGITPALLPSQPLKVRPVQHWRLPALRWHPCPHHLGVIARFVLLLSSPALHRRCCPWRAGVFALIACPSRWRLPFRCHCRTWSPHRIRCR